MVVAFYFRLHLAYFPRPVVAIFARPEQLSGCKSGTSLVQCHLGWPFVKIWTDRETY